MTYYVMMAEGAHPIRPIAKGPEGMGNWRDGSPVGRRVPRPLVYTLRSGVAGDPKPMYYAEAVPVMRDDVVATLRRAGVQNIEYFDAVLEDPDNGREYGDYKAYNIVGLVACADAAASKLMDTNESDLLDMDFESLVIDESRTGGALLFRLAENVSAIVVHAQVKRAIEASGIPGFVFYGPGEWSG